MRKNAETPAFQPCDEYGRPFAWRLVRNHVMPVNDLRDHSFADCWCDPFDEEGFTVHNSLDGRELYQSGKKLVS